MDFGLELKYINLLKSIFEKYPFIERVILFGSRAKGNYTERSDIDLAVFGNPKDRFELSKILEEIEDSILPYNTDIQLVDSIKNSELLDHINRVGQVFYQKN